MPQFEVRYYVGDKAIQSTIVHASDDMVAFCIVEEELKETDEGYKILSINRVN